jgi:hypothetical protein
MVGRRLPEGTDAAIEVSAFLLHRRYLNSVATMIEQVAASARAMAASPSKSRG